MGGGNSAQVHHYMTSLEWGGQWDNEVFMNAERSQCRRDFSPTLNIHGGQKSSMSIGAGVLRAKTQHSFYIPNPDWRDVDDSPLALPNLTITR